MIIITNSNLTYLTQGNLIIIIISSPSPFLSLYQPTELITPAVQQPPVSTVAQEKVLLQVQRQMIGFGGD